MGLGSDKVLPTFEQSARPNDPDAGRQVPNHFEHGEEHDPWRSVILEEAIIVLRPVPAAYREQRYWRQAGWVQGDEVDI